jgi:hypothetical protein
MINKNIRLINGRKIRLNKLKSHALIYAEDITMLRIYSISNKKFV